MAGDNNWRFFQTLHRAALGILAANLILDPPKFARSNITIRCRLRNPTDVQIVKLATKMRPALACTLILLV
ncbi:hypothetical protein EDF68_11916 [Ochrobactrum sp. BH3]|nr:hypothetical protein EDF68_11916 [Ochrobactrum sp. BH3]